MSWVSKEFNDIHLSDSRLKKRLIKTTTHLFNKPMSPINEACGSWKDTKAAYRLFDNSKFCREKLLESHRRKTMKRMKEYEVILAIQDTTFFNYDKHKSKTGLGPIHSNNRPIQGLLAHNTFIVNKNGLPLGLFDQKIYARKNQKKSIPSYYPIEKKESYRWLEPLEKLSKLPTKKQKVIFVGDREADIFELMHECQDIGLEYLIRSSHNRSVGDRTKRWTKEKDKYLSDLIKELKIQEIKEFKVPSHHTDKERVANLAIKFSQVELPAPWRLDYAIDGPSQKNKKRKPGTRAKVFAYLVDVKEVKAPKGKKPVHWRLITSLPVESIDDAHDVIEYYKKRWNIEIFHRVLKSGCKIEDCRLEKIERLERCITLYSIIAWRLFFLSRISREKANDSCNKYFSKKEWSTIYKVANKKKRVPKNIPTIDEMMIWLAKLGGFLGRKSDGIPGITVIWRGWQKLNYFLEFRTYG